MRKSRHFCLISLADEVKLEKRFQLVVLLVVPGAWVVHAERAVWCTTVSPLRFLAHVVKVSDIAFFPIRKYIFVHTDFVLELLVLGG